MLFRSQANDLGSDLVVKVAPNGQDLRLIDKQGRDITALSLTPDAASLALGASGGEVTVEGKDFADAMFRNWLGEEPADTTAAEERSTADPTA